MKNKKALSIAAVALLMGVTASFAQTSGKLTIKGNLSDVKDTLVIGAVNFGEYRASTIGQPVVNGGAFDFATELDQPKMLVIHRPFKQQGNSRIMCSISLPGIPGESFTLTGTTIRATVDGTAFYKQYAPINEIINNYLSAVYDISDNKSTRKMDDVQDELVRQLMSHVRKHPTEEASMVAAYFIPGDSLETFKSIIDPKVLDGRLKGIVEAADNRFKAEKQQEEAKQIVAAGKPAPDFTLNDINGKPFTLSSLRGKYVILDFWGSWCGWCIKGMPDMKKYYEKYSGKFEIVGIDCNDTVEKWKAAVEKHQLPWLHVRNEQKDNVPSMYAISGYPTKIVVAPDGTIAKVIEGESPEFYTYLDELFSK